MDGGWSHMLRVFLERLLVGPAGLSTVGMQITIGGRQRLLFARLTNLLSDGDGHRMAMDWKGASGLKPCWKHFNVWKKGSALACRRPGHVEIDSPECAVFLRWSAQQVYQNVDLLVASKARVDAGELSNGEHATREKVLGMNANAKGLLSSPLLRRRETTPQLDAYLRRQLCKCRSTLLRSDVGISDAVARQT